MFETYELGPTLHSVAPEFKLYNHQRQMQCLTDVMGVRGVLLGFVGDIWMPTSIRRIFWLQRHATKFAMAGAPIALLVRDQHHTLYGFRMTSPFPVQFPMLADPDGVVHRLYRMQHNPGLILLDRRQVVQAKWRMPDERVSPSMKDLISMIESLPER